MIRSLVMTLSLAASITSCRNSSSNDGNVPDNPIQPTTETCPALQKKVLEDSNWDLNVGLEQVLDNILEKKPTSEPIPLCT